MGKHFDARELDTMHQMQGRGCIVDRLLLFATVAVRILGMRRTAQHTTLKPTEAHRSSPRRTEAGSWHSVTQCKQTQTLTLRTR